MGAKAVAAAVAFSLLAHLQIVLAQGTAEVETILYKAADALGMLRTPREVDRVATMIFSGTGTLTLDSEVCVMEHYRAGIRYPIPNARHTFPVPGMRVDFSCAREDDEQERHIHVVAGDLAWDETEPGLNATPAPETVRERLLQVWILPQGLVKAAAVAGPLVTASTEAGNPVLTFPLPAPLDDTVVKVTLDPEVFLSHTMPTGLKREFSHRITRVETRFDGVVMEVTYANYQDWNHADYKSDVLLPGRIVHRLGGTTTLELTLTHSNTYNPYVVMPVPENIPRAASGAVGRRNGGSCYSPAILRLTPRSRGGYSDASQLTGNGHFEPDVERRAGFGPSRGPSPVRSGQRRHDHRCHDEGDVDQSARTLVHGRHG
jgi:hypothetical protein